MRFFRFCILFCVVQLLAILHAIGQNDSLLVDERDGKQYKTKQLAGSIWMLENLSYKTPLSFGVPDTLLLENPPFRGRWYHMNELDSICPKGWELPSVEDWVRYFDYLATVSEGEYKMKTWKTDYQLAEFDQYFDLFEKGNPLEIIPAGIYEGNLFRYAPFSADYWIKDLETRRNGKGSSFKLVKESQPGTAHIHLYNQFTQIHSHKHHLEPEKPTELRKFLCRCIKKEEK